MEFAIEISIKLEAKITFVHVAESILADSVLNPESYKKLDATIAAHAGNKMDALLEKYKATCPGCAGVVLRGDTVDFAPERIMVLPVQFVNVPHECQVGGTGGFGAVLATSEGVRYFT